MIGVISVTFAAATLNVLAALVPIAASLYATGSLLIEYAERRRAVRIVAHVRQTYPPAQHGMLYTAHGLDPAIGTYTAAKRAVLPQPPSPVELRRQWVLLLGSALGVILLALGQVA